MFLYALVLKGVMTRLDPWKPDIPQDYEQLAEQFGLKRFSDALLKKMPDSYMFRRNIVFAHRDFETIADAMLKKKPFAAMTGIKPSNHLHIGSKLVVDQLKYLQDAGGQVVYSVADVETYHANRQSLADSRKIAESNITDLLALGISEDAYFYFQSAEPRVKLNGYLYGRDVTFNMLKAIYGEQQIGHYVSALMQVADILLPEMPEFGGPKPVVVPVGLDQDPHIRLTRDIAGKHKLIVPSSTYNRFMRSLTGSDKMSKSEPMGMISLSETPSSAKKKIMRAFTGGKPTVEEQKKEGANPKICPVYDLLLYLEEDDKVVKERFQECSQGKIMCGACKKDVAERVVKFLEGHQKKREKLAPKAKRVVEKVSKC